VGSHRDACCPSCAMGLEQHDASCPGGVGPTVHQRDTHNHRRLPRSLTSLLCRKGCGRRVTLGLTARGRLLDTCCRACAHREAGEPINHDDECTGCGIPDALGPNGLQGHCNAEEETAIGIVVGAMCGDVLGARVKGRSEEDIQRRYPRGMVDFRVGRNGLANYTDSTEGTLALLCCLLDDRGFNAENATRWHCCIYSPWRGYHPSATALIEELRAGRLSYRDSGRAQFADGSHGNRGANRVAPVGFVYRHCNEATMRAAVEAACQCSHVHPIAIDAAVIHAHAIAILANVRIMCEGGDQNSDIGPKELVQRLKAFAETEEMAAKLDATLQGLHLWETQGPSSSLCASVRSGITDPVQIRATDAVASSLWAMCTHWEQPREAVVRAASFGGDSTAIASMVGGLAGARHGWKWIPVGWFNALENDTLGRDHAIVYAMDLTKLATPQDVA